MSLILVSAVPTRGFAPPPLRCTFVPSRVPSRAGNRPAARLFVRVSGRSKRVCAAQPFAPRPAHPVGAHRLRAPEPLLPPLRLVPRRRGEARLGQLVLREVPALRAPRGAARVRRAVRQR